MEQVETLVIGAGVVGLAAARQLALAGHEVLVIDTAMEIGTGTSSRNSEVIHAGIYYPPGSLKAKLCVEGRELLYAFCASHGVATRRLGKLIVAVTEAEIPKLEALSKVARQNGVHDLEWKSEQEVAALEPAVACKRALLSPSTGIVDSHGFMLALQGDAEAHSAVVSLGTSFESAVWSDGRFAVTMRDGSGEAFTLACRNIVNSAGHGAHAAAAAISGFDSAHLPPRFLAKGNYCAVSGRAPFKHLIYPMPVPGALGVHVTLDMSGAAKLGPNIEWVPELEYSVSESIADEFREACAMYWPGIGNHALTPSYCGIRPKVHGPDASFADFIIQGPETHGAAGLVNLFGIESPGLTSSLAIGRHVTALLG